MVQRESLARKMEFSELSDNNFLYMHIPKRFNTTGNVFEEWLNVNSIPYPLCSSFYLKWRFWWTNSGLLSSLFSSKVYFDNGNLNTLFLNNWSGVELTLDFTQVREWNRVCWFLRVLTSYFGNSFNICIEF